MALYIKKYQSKRRNSTSYGKWYGRPVMLGTATIDELATEIEEKCTVTHSDILAVLAALGVSIKHKLQESKRVRIDFLGTFKLGVNSSGVIKESDYDVKSNIKDVHVVFQPETTVENGHRVKELTRGARVAELAKMLKPATATNGTTNGTTQGEEPGDGNETGGGDNGGNDGNQDPIEERP